jgi:hypothetical protein
MTTVPAAQQLEYILRVRDDCDEESEDREKHDVTYDEGPCIATEGEDIPGHAKILEYYDDSRREKEELYASAGQAFGG